MCERYLGLKKGGCIIDMWEDTVVRDCMLLYSLLQKKERVCNCIICYKGMREYVIV